MVFALSFLIISYLQVLSSKFTKSNHCCFSIYSFHAFFMSKRQGHKIITMRKKIIFPVAVLIFILAMFLFSVIGGGSKIAIECKPVADKSKVPSNIHLDVYVENSGSMDGYMCPGSNLKDAVYDYISDLSKVTSSNSFYYLNSAAF